jgi:hypothetical protein
MVGAVADLRNWMPGGGSIGCSFTWSPPEGSLREYPRLFRGDGLDAEPNHGPVVPRDLLGILVVATLDNQFEINHAGIANHLGRELDHLETALLR